MTQPTLSTAVRELEEALGLVLLERTKRKVLLTPEGALIAERAQSILLDCESLSEYAQGLSRPLSGDLRMGIIPTIAPYLLPVIMGPIRKHFPDLRLYLKESQTAPLLDLLHQGELDVLILALPYEDDTIDKSIFMSDAFVVALPKGHPLSKKKTLSQKDLETEDLLLLEEGHCLRDHALAACSLTSLGARREFGATSLSTIVEMVAGGLGITLLPELALKGGLTKGSDIAIRPLEDHAPKRDIGLVWRKSSGREEEFKTLCEFLKQEAGK